MSPTEPNDDDKKFPSSKVAKTGVRKLTQLTLWKQPFATKTVQTKKYINKNGTFVQSHTVRKLTQLTLWKQPLATKTVQVKKYIDKNGTVVQSHTRTIQFKQKKAQPKLHSQTKKAHRQELVANSKQTSNYFPHPSAFDNINEKTKNKTMSKLIDDLHNKVKGNSNKH